jgi:hypothetical protein
MHGNGRRGLVEKRKRRGEESRGVSKSVKYLHAIFSVFLSLFFFSFFPYYLLILPDLFLSLKLHMMRMVSSCWLVLVSPSRFDPGLCP